MAEEEVKMEPVDMTPVAAELPPKANPLAKPTVTATLKPGLRLPPKPGATVTGLKPGLKLPPKANSLAKPTVTATLKPGLRLPPKPGATVTGLKPGLKLPPKPGATVVGLKTSATVTGLKPGLRLPPKPGATVTAMKPVIRKPGVTATQHPLPKPVAVDAQGVGKLPTVEAKTMTPEEVKVPTPAQPKPIDQLKSVTQKLKGITQQVPQQAILHKTGIIADGVMSGAQKEAAKHKTARISLSEAIGVAPVKDATPMKTIRIKRPIDIPNATKPLTPLAKPASLAATATSAPVNTEVETKAAETTTATVSAASSTATATQSTITQRKTLKIARPGGAVRPSGKFSIKRPGASSSTVTKNPAAGDSAKADGVVTPAVSDIADIPSMPIPNMPAAKVISDGPAWLWALSSLVQVAACVAIGVVAYFLYENVNTLYF